MRVYTILLIGVLLCLGSVTTPSQPIRKEESITFRGFVEEVQESPYAPGVEPPESAYVTAYYAVLKVCEGKLDESSIRVAHRIATPKGLKVGDTVCMRVNRSDELKQFAQDLWKLWGIYLPEEDRADYWYAGFNQPCSCEM